MERLEYIPKPSDNSHLILKNFEKILVGSIDNEIEIDGADVIAESNKITSPKIIAISNNRNFVSAKREQLNSAILEGPRFFRTIQPGMNNKAQPKKRSLTRKTAIISPSPTNPLYAW